MPKKVEYKYECFVEHPDGRVERLNDMPKEERNRLAVLWGQRMAETLSEYYSVHPEEYFSRHPQNA